MKKIVIFVDGIDDPGFKALALTLAECLDALSKVARADMLMVVEDGSDPGAPTTQLDPTAN